jgi:hypothetical protein
LTGLRRRARARTVVYPSIVNQINSLNSGTEFRARNMNVGSG